MGKAIEIKTERGEDGLVVVQVHFPFFYCQRYTGEPVKMTTAKIFAIREAVRAIEEVASKEIKRLEAEAAKSGKPKRKDGQDV